MIALQRLASLLNTLFAHVGIVEAAPETETILVSCISRYILLKRTADPRTMHYRRVQHTYLVHRLAPLGNLFLRLCVVVSVHVDNIEFGALNLRHRNIVHNLRSKILQQYLVSRTCRRLILYFRFTTCRHYECGEN